MRITLLGVLGFLALAALLIYLGYKLQQKTEQNEPPPRTNPPLPPENL